MAVNRVCSRFLLNIAYHNNKAVLSLQLKTTKNTFAPTFSLCKKYSTDSSDNNLKEIYSGTLSSKIRFIKCFSLSTSAISLCLQPILYQEIARLNNIPAAIIAYSFVGIFTFATPLLLHYITKKYVIRLQYDSSNDKYIATRYGFFCTEKKIEFTKDDVHVPDIPGLFTTFHVKGTPVFLDTTIFGTSSHYGTLMGYDKPVDFKLYETSFNEKKK